MEGGTISGNNAIGVRGSSGGGVQIGDKSVFTMTGGTISGNGVQGNNGNSQGGGVSVSGVGGTFVMKGGIITENTNTSVGWAHSGGVYVGSDDGGISFTMTGGTISGNSANGRNGASGGGVHVYNGTFTMTGGEIMGNSAQGGEAKGGGVRVSGTLTMTGGAIYGNSAQGRTLSVGGGVFFEGVKGVISLFTMSGGRIQGGTASDGFTRNIVIGGSQFGAALNLDNYEGTATAKWGIGGTYTKGGVNQTGGSDIVSTGPRSGIPTDDTLIAIPAR
jgi:hypothetical protein